MKKLKHYMIVLINVLMKEKHNWYNYYNDKNDYYKDLYNLAINLVYQSYFYIL